MKHKNVGLGKYRLSNEVLFVLYFWGFAFMKPIVTEYTNISTLILVLYSVGLFLISIFKNIKVGLKLKKVLIIVIPVYSGLLLDYLTRQSMYSIVYMYEFTIYGVLPVYFLNQVKNTRKLLNVYSYVAVIIFILYGLDPLNGYKYTGDYMTFGFQFILPAYLGINIGRTLFKRKWLCVIEVLCLLDLIIFANRSCMLSVIVYLVIKTLLFGTITLKKIYGYTIIFILTVIIFANISEIISYINNILAQNGYYSYGLTAINQWLTDSSLVDITSGRLDIWSNSIEMIKANMLIGTGSGQFISQYGIYTHNIILDLLLDYGVLVCSGFIIVIFIQIKNVMRNNIYEVKFLGVVFLSMWFPKLFLSIYLFKDMGIWCFIIWGMISKNYIQKNYT